MRLGSISKWLLALGLCLSCGSALPIGNKRLPAQAYVYVAPTAPTCPKGTSLPDGCSGANPASTFQVANAFASGGHVNTVAGTSTNYTTTPNPANQAGSDYPVAAYTPIGSALDPVASPPTGCTSSTGPYGNPRLTCTGPTFVGPVSGYNFGAAFSHACTSLYINPTGITASKISITNNYFTNDGNCGFGAFSEFMVNAGSYTFETDIMFNTFQGNGTTYPLNTCISTALDGGATCNGAAALNTYGIVKIEYNSFVNFAARPIYCNMTAGQLTDITFRYNYVEGWDYHPYNGHTEFMVCNPGGSTNVNIGMHADYNTIIQTTNGMQFGPSPFWLASSYPVDYVNGLDLIGNTIIGSFVGNAAYTATTSGCVGATSACTAPGSNFYVSTTTANVGTGEELGGAQGGAQCVTPSGTATVSSITAPSGGTSTMVVTGTPTVALEVGGTFTLAAYGANTMTIQSITTGIGAAGTYVINNSNTGSYTGPGTATINAWTVFAWISSHIAGGQGNGSSWTLDSSSLPPGLHLEGPATCTNITMWAVSSNTYAWQGNNVRSSSTITIQGNYIDGSSSWVPRDGTVPWVIFTMGGSSGRVWTCANPSIVNGNVDMAGVAGAGQLNPDFTGASFTSGCGGLATPAITPLVSSNFNPNQTASLTSNQLTPNAGVAGATEFPSTPTNSAAFYFEMEVNPALRYGNGSEFPFANMSMNVNSSAGQPDPGQPSFFFNRQWNGAVPGSWWWLNPGTTSSTGGTANAGGGLYKDGFYPFTAPSSGCTRPPSGVWLGNTGTFQQTDPGFGCPTGSVSLNATQIAASIPDSGAQQTVTSASCASGGAGILVTTSVPVSPGLSPALQYTVNLTGTGGTSLNPATLTATSVTGSGPYTVVGTIAGTCPTGLAGTINSGTGASIGFPTVSTTTPYNSGLTGIATHNGQHICGWIVENGSDSNFPGSQAIAMVDNNGNSLTGSPALVPFLNQGLTSTFTGSTNGSTAVLNVTAIPAFTITGATYSAITGYVTFTTSSSPGLVPGSEVNILNVVTSPSSPNLFNGAYVAVAGTGGTTIVAEPLTGDAGTPQPFGSSPGTYSSGGSMYSVPLPGQEVSNLSTYVIILPYGTNGTTGIGGLGTYALSAVPAAASSSSLTAYGGFYYTFSGTTRTQASIGDFITEFGNGFGGSLGNFATLWGKVPTQAGGAPSTADLASICTKQTDIAGYAASKGITVHSLYRMNDLGIWGDSGVADFTGSIAGTTLTVASTQFGALPTVTAGVPSITISGAGITGCPASCPTISSGSGSSYFLSASGGTVASEPMKAGTFNPATPNAANTFKGYIDTTSGISTLHVTSFDNGGTHAGFASFTGSYNPATGVLTDNVAGVGSIPVGSVVSDGNASISTPMLITSFISGPPYTYNVAANYYPTITSDATMWATTSSVVPGEYILNSTASPAIVNPVKIVGGSWTACGIAGAYNGLLGCYTLSGSPNSSNAVGSLGSQVVFTGTTITDGGAIAPGPALTIDDTGPGAVFPVTFGTNLGTLALSGTYNTTALGGTPSGIQVLVSNSANGPPLTGCTNCNWGTLTGTISGGIWKGTIASIPGGGPYFVSVRALNGPAYATVAQAIRVGAAYATWGNGQAQSYFGNQGGGDTSYFSALWGTGGGGSAFGIGNDPYVVGPPLIGDFVPNQPFNVAGDRFGVPAGSPESVLTFDQKITDSLGVPASIFYAARDGIGQDVYTLGNVLQTQTIGVGDGSSTVWCSSATFCTEPTGGVQTPLTFNGASLTGVWLNGSVSSNVLTVTTRYGGAIEPGQVLGATGSPTVLRCLTSCTTPLAIDGSTWLLSSSSASGATGTLTSPLRADPPSSLIPFGGTTTPWPDLNIQPALPSNFAGFGMSLIKVGTAKFTDGTNSCTDTTAFAYNLSGGLCTGITGVSAWENYITGDYRVAFTTPPVVGAPVIATWTNIVSPNAPSTLRPYNGDQMGDGTSQSGFVSSRFSRFPGGVSGQIWASQGTDKPYMFNASSPFHTGYPFGAPGYSEMLSHLYSVKFPALVPGYSASTPFLTMPFIRVERPASFYTDLADNAGTSQYAQDATTQSTLSGTVSAGVLTLGSSAAVGPMWTGEVIDCVTVSTSCPINPQSGVYITGLTGGTWGAALSTYSLANASGLTVSPAGAMQNAVYYSGAGPTLFLGALYDVQSYEGTHPGGGMAGGRRAMSRAAAMIYGANGGAVSDPKVDRVKADAVGCDAAALAAPCFDIGSTYQASASGTISGSTVTFTGGLSAHARPFVVGMALSCAGCTGGRVITSVSAPPTQSTTSGAGQVGNTFTITASASLGVSTTETVNGGCSGTSGTGSNCIDIAVSMTAGTALDTCGSNMLNGTASGTSSAPSPVPNGKCQGSQIGDLTRGFRIGTGQQANGNGSTGPAGGSVFDDGFDPAAGWFIQSSAFTCNIVAAKVAQCVRGSGQWTNPTYIAYGDSVVVASRHGTLLGYVGGQSFPFTAGSGYTNGTTQPTVTCSGGGTAPIFDVTVSGGAIANVAPAGSGAAIGLNLVSTCTVALPSGGSGGAIPTIQLAPVEGVGGIGQYSTDNNTMGTFLYDNSCLSTLSKFFSNGVGGCFEPGLPLRPFGQGQEEGVSG